MDWLEPASGWLPVPLAESAQQWCVVPGYQMVPDDGAGTKWRGWRPSGAEVLYTLHDVRHSAPCSHVLLRYYM